MTYPSFGTDGVRGVANAELTPELAVALGRAAAEILGSTTVVVGRDSRRSGPMLEAALVAGIAAAGVDAELLGVVPTPAVAWVAKSESKAGAMISASHNPFADNGIKLFAEGGRKLSDGVEAKIQARFHELLDVGPSEGPIGEAVGDIRASGAAHSWSGDVVESAGTVRFDGLSILLDCANGAASDYAAEVFTLLGASTTVMAANPDGININEGVGSTYPQAMCDAVLAAGADLGLAFDGDADRLIACDSNGALVDGDHILAILAKDWSQRGVLAHNTVAVTVMSNLGFRLAMDELGVSVVETNVGDRYVLEALAAGQLSLGGEQSGHVICHDIASTGDGVLAGVQLVCAVVRSGQSLANLSSAAMTTVPQVLRNVRLPHRDPGLLDRLSGLIESTEAEMGNEGRILVRASGTEPLLRVMVEHLDAATADAVCAKLIDAAERAVRTE